eukprot:COSAG04_NODE_26343_length_296_cov_0.390863_1_plen_27_part_01
MRVCVAEAGICADERKPAATPPMTEPT